MSVRSTLITEPDLLRLAGLLEAASRWPAEHAGHSRALRGILANAVVVPEHQVPADVVTLHSRVRVKDLGLGHEKTWLLVEPAHALASAGNISVLSPLGAALLGRRRGDVVEYRGPSGPRRLRIQQVLFQPEATRPRPANETPGNIGRPRSLSTPAAAPAETPGLAGSSLARSLPAPAAPPQEPGQDGLAESTPGSEEHRP